MNRLSRRGFLRLSAGTATGLWLAGCTTIQAPPSEPKTLPPLPAIEPAEVNLLGAEQEEKLGKVVDYIVDSSHVPGIGLGLVRDGEVIYAKGFGVTKIGAEQRVTTQTLFQIMDLTHTFTAAAAMQLVEQGKLKLDAPVVEYLPYFRLADQRYTQVTVRHLLLETAGLPPTPERTPTKDWEGKTRQTDDGALERYVRSLSEVKLIADPGVGHLFCNMAYDIAGDVIAKVSGEVFEEYMTQHILQPLGMTTSTFYPEQADPALLAMPHVVEGGTVVVSELITHSRERSPSVGLFSNVMDLNRWVLTNLNRGELGDVRILQDASYDELWAPAYDITAISGRDISGVGDFEAKGLGWFIGANRNRPIRQYGSVDVGFHAACYLFPETKTGAVAMGNQFTSVNTTAFYAFTIAKTAIDIFEM